VQLHGIPASKVIPTGAPTFDFWFTPDYKQPREHFLRSIGLRPDDRYITYVCSSSISGAEESIIAELASSLRQCESTKGLRIIVRRHPSPIKRIKPLNIEGVSFWPAKGVVPDTFELRRDYFNTLYHATAVVGINTSAFVEAAILDRPCISITPESLRFCQSEMPHFNYLVQAGFLAIAHDAGAVVAQVIELMAGNDSYCEARRKFVRSFVRPVQDGRPACRVTADAIKSSIRSNIVSISGENYSGKYYSGFQMD